MRSTNVVSVAMHKSLARLVIFVLPVFALIFFILLRWFDERLYLHLMYEDRPLEVLTAILYLVASLLAVNTAMGLTKFRKLWLGSIYYIFAIGLFFIAGEEISWGQRIFGVVSPEYFMENSSQQEINVHNLKPVQAILHKIYMVVGFLGATLWIGLVTSGKHGMIFNRWFIPNWYLSLYFLPVALFYVYLDFIRPVNDFLSVMGRDQEPNEFLLCLGFFLLVMENWLRMRAIRKKPASSIVSIEINSGYGLKDD